MHLPAFLSPRRAAALSLVLLCSACAAAWAVGVRGDGASAPPPERTEAGRPVFRRSIRVWVHPDGVRPAVVRAEPGPVTLHAENETGGDVALVLERVNPGRGGERVARVVTSRGGKRSRQELELGAGEYVFYEESRPQLRGRLIVEKGGR